MIAHIRYAIFLLVGISIVLTLLLGYPEVNRSRAKARIPASTGRPDPRPVSVAEKTKTTNFKPSFDGAKTWEWLTSWSNFNSFSESIDTRTYFPTVPGQITAGFVHHWDGGHWPLPNQERKTVEFVGTVWFDLSEIFSKPPLPKAEYAMLTFKAIASDGPGGKCKDELRLPSDDWMKGLPDNTLPRTGSLEPPVYFEGCPPAGCSVEVTSIVNNWIKGTEDRFGFAISGLDDLAAIGTDGGKNPDNNAHCTTRYGDFTLTVTYVYQDIKYVLPGSTPPGPGGALETRKNWALASNGATAKALSQFNENYPPSAAINGEVLGIHKGSDPATGSLWHSETPTFPQWLEVEFFGGEKVINEIDLFTFQDDVDAPKSVYEGATTFSKDKYGLTQFVLQRWHNKFGWIDIPNTSFTAAKLNSFVWNRFNLKPNIQTSKIRVLTNASGDGYSRIVELEAWGK